MISLDTEFIENDKMLTDKQKQDCETKAFKRMIERIKKIPLNINSLLRGMVFMPLFQ